jgi:hypothetical protein
MILTGEKLAEQRRSLGCATVFFAGLLLFFVVMGAFATARPVVRAVRALGWRAVPCTIVDSQVEHRGKTYAAAVRYRYQVDGRWFEGNRHDFVGASSSRYEHVQSVTERHPAGANVTCWINPRHPQDSVLERGLTLSMWPGLLPVFFVLLAVWGWRAVRRKIVADAESSNKTPVVPPQPPPRPASRGYLFVGALIAALFWNGLLSVFLARVLPGLRSPDPPWFQGLLLLPFVIVGLCLFGMAVYRFLALFNPRVSLTVTPNQVPLGGSAEVTWELTGNISHVRGLTITLEGREEAEYRRGTDKVTARSVFRRVTVAEGDAYGGIRRGSALLRVPPQTMHSFSSEHNRIVWSLRLQADVPFWPDVAEELPIVVLPRDGRVARGDQA